MCTYYNIYFTVCCTECDLYCHKAGCDDVIDNVNCLSVSSLYDAV